MARKKLPKGELKKIIQLFVKEKVHGKAKKEFEQRAEEYNMGDRDRK